MTLSETTVKPEPYVVLVTGSRHDNPALRALVHRELDTLFDRVHTTGRHLLVRHGACPTGVDHYTGEWVARQSISTVTEDRHPADWSGPCRDECDHGPRVQSASGRTGCPAAGPYRNRDMVGLGADVVLAFPVGPSRGTRGTMRLAKAAGLTIHLPIELRTSRGVA